MPFDADENWVRRNYVHQVSRISLMLLSPKIATFVPSHWGCRNEPDNFVPVKALASPTFLGIPTDDLAAVLHSRAPLTILANKKSPRTTLNLTAHWMGASREIHGAVMIP